MSRDEATQDAWAVEEDAGGGLPDFLLDPLGVLQRRWIAMALCLVVGSAATGVVWATWKPVYQAQATVLITSQQIPEDFVRPTVREDTLENINAMIGTVLTQENLSRLIDEKGLFSDKRDKVPRIDLVNRMRARVDAAPLSRAKRRSEAEVYGISYLSADPAEAAEVANALAALFVEASIERRNSQARLTTQFLRHELERDEREFREQSKLVSEFRRKHRGELPSELETNLRKLDMLTARRTSLADQIAAKEQRIIELSSRGGQGPPTENEVLLDELRRQLARESAVNTDAHPNVIALRNRIARLEKIVQDQPGIANDAQRKKMIESEQGEIERLRKDGEDAEAQIAELNRRVDKTPSVDEELTALQQKEQVLREQYLQSLRKVEEAQLAESLETAQQGGQVSVLDSAQKPTQPERPRWLVVVGGLGASFALAVGLAVLLELLDPVVVGARQLESLSDRPVLGSLPKIA